MNYKGSTCFNALHGPFGEDGQIQKILKKNNIKYTHSSIKSSSICFDKVRAKKIILKNNILSPQYTILKKKDFTKKKLKKIKEKYKKFIIKPNQSGSSFGIIIIKNNKDFKIFLNNIKNFKKKFLYHKNFLIEEFIIGKELTVSTIKFKKEIQPLAVTEIKYKNSFFDYNAKYSKGHADHIIPAKLNKKNYEKCLKIASQSHKLLGCGSIARTDFIYNSKNNKIYYLETNTQPGLTSVSLLPEQAKYKNISFQYLIKEMLKKTI